ncbi:MULTISPECIES: two-component system VirA-like sensor kinase [unclassified Sinorhizobium]|uniref:two-component system VirA-like sensor kinase n=1 Tax=unclassified Sinorhizobium TaxID=2613772 RepID=UPI003523ED4B
MQLHAAYKKSILFHEARAFVLAIFGATIFALIALEQVPNRATHDSIVTTLRIIDLENANLQQDVLKARSGQLLNYDPIVSSFEGLHEAVARLRMLLPRIGTDTDRLNRSLNELAASIDTNEALVEQFKSRNASLQNSLTVFDELLAQDPGSDGRVASWSKFSNLMMRFSMKPDWQIGQNLMAELSKTATQNPDERVVLDNLGAHTRSALADLSFVDQLISTIQAGDIERNARKLQQQFLDAYGRANASANFRRMAVGFISILLWGYVAVLSYRLSNKTRLLRRRLDFESFLRTTQHEFDDAVSREDVCTTAVRALSVFTKFFAADRFSLELIEPRTGATVEYFESKQPPLPLLPEVKADFINKVGSSSDEAAAGRSHFVDLTNRRESISTPKWMTVAVVGGVRTPLGRVGILQLAFDRPRLKLNEDEVSLLCNGLFALFQATLQHARRQEREDLEKRLKHAERLKAVGTLAGGIAHEFNNILGAILGYGEMAMQRAGRAGPVTPYVKQMVDTAKRAERIVNQILTLSRNREQEREPFNLADAVADALPLIAASLPNLQVRTALSAEGAVMLGHPVELQQIMMNLCKNAWEASNGNARVEVEIEVKTVEVASVMSLTLGLLQPGKYLCLRIADNGKGIASEVLPHIFDPFFTTREQSGGSGLGLTAVHGLVTGLSGRINVTSDIGKGACFDLYFPYSDLTPIPLSQFFEVTKVPLGNGQRIVLLEHDVGSLAMSEEKVAALGYEPVGFSDIDQMKDWLAEKTADLIVIDALSVPPHYSARDIENIARGTVFIVIPDREHRGSLQLGSLPNTTLLQKPLSSKALADVIAEQLRRHVESEPRSLLPTLPRNTSQDSPVAFRTGSHRG